MWEGLIVLLDLVDLEWAKFAIVTVRQKIVKDMFRDAGHVELMLKENLFALGAIITVMDV